MAIQPPSSHNLSQEAFTRAKDLLTSDRLLVHYDPSLEVVVAGDASEYGIGAVLSHKMPGGEEKPIGVRLAYTIVSGKELFTGEKEALALIFAVKRFHSYICGREFILFTDHKPLLTLLGEHKAISTQASARIQRWALTLAAYKYVIEFRSTKAHYYPATVSVTSSWSVSARSMASGMNNRNDGHHCTEERR